MVLEKNGIWGMANDGLLDWTNNGTVFEDIVSQKGIYNVFSLCLSFSGGVMDFGEQYTTSDGFQFTPLQLVDGYSIWYNVIVSDMKFNGESLGLASEDYDYPIVDSGTTLLYVPHPAYVSITNTLSTHFSNLGFNMTQFLLGYGVEMTQGEMSQLPDLDVYLNGITSAFTIPPSSWIFPQGDYSYFGIVDSGETGEEAFTVGTILGDVFMENFHVFFDRQNAQIGIAARSTCPTTTTGSVSTTGTASATAHATTVTGSTSKSSASKTTLHFMLVLGLFLVLLMH